MTIIKSQTAVAISPILLFLGAIVWTHSASALEPERDIPNTRVELHCTIDPGAVTLAANDGRSTGLTEEGVRDFLKSYDLFEFRVAYWETTMTCRGLIGLHKTTCVISDNAVSFWHPELPFSPGKPQALLLDRYTGNIRFINSKYLQHNCKVRDRRF